MTDALKRAERVIELDAITPPGPWTAGGCKDHPGESGRGLPCFRVRGPDVADVFPAGARWVQETRALSVALAADVRRLVELWKACERYCQHVPEIADRAAALGLLPPREDKPEPTLAERIEAARERLSELKAARKRALGQDTYDHIDEQVSNAQEYLAELEDEARESVPHPVAPEEADRNDLLAAEFSREDKLAESARCGDGKEEGNV